jgi:hypothetical protein
MGKGGERGKRGKRGKREGGKEHGTRQEAKKE